MPTIVTLFCLYHFQSQAMPSAPSRENVQQYPEPVVPASLCLQHISDPLTQRQHLLARHVWARMQSFTHTKITANTWASEILYVFFLFLYLYLSWKIQNIQKVVKREVMILTRKHETA